MWNTSIPIVLVLVEFVSFELCIFLFVSSLSLVAFLLPLPCSSIFLLPPASQPSAQP